MADFNIMPIAEVLGYGDAEDGERLLVQVKDDRGVECRILIPHELEAHFNSQLSMAAMAASEKRAKRGGQPELSIPIHIKQMQGMPADNGIMILRLRMANGMKLDMPLDQKTRDNLRDMMDQIEVKLAGKPDSKSN